MINISSIFLLITVTLFSFFWERRVKPLFIFNLWWLLWVSMSQLNLMNFYEVIDEIYAHISISIFVFNAMYVVVSVFLCKIKINLLGGGENKLWVFCKQKSLIFLFSYIALTMLLIIRMIALIDADLSQYWKARFIYFSIPIGSESQIISLFPSAMLATLYQSLSFFIIVFFMIGLAENNKKIIFTSLIAIMSLSILTTGREIIIFFVLYVIFSFKTKAIYKNLKTIFFVAVFILGVSIFRGSVGTLMYAFMSYFTGSIAYLNVLLHSNIDNNNLYYGQVILSQVFSFIYNIYGLFTQGELVKPFSVIGNNLMEFQRISDSSKFYDYYNAIPTWYYFFYSDFGIWGFYIYPILIALLFGVLYRFLSIHIKAHCVLAAFLETCLLWSIFKPMLFEPSVIMVILFFILILGSKSKLCQLPSV
ncbi:O-antigen polymerase [Aeromonas veronii]|uniref:O-antigen polymerase n=1 Tax=Aeromonas veronii TaxID=654 RepID=UPI003D1C2581